MLDAVVTGFGVRLSEGGAEQDRGVSNIAAKFNANAGFGFEDEVGDDFSCQRFKVSI